MEKLRIIVGGFLGILPAGGVTWDYVQYPLGLFQLGHDVYYIEDTRLYPMYQKPGSAWDDASSCVEHLKKVMEHFGMGDRWAYRDEASGASFGLSENRIREICQTADVFLNVSCSTVMREEYARIPIRILLDSDPMFTQIQLKTQQGFTPGVFQLGPLVEQHNYHFTFGENIGAEDCRIPDCGINWTPTRQPVCLDHWPVRPAPPASQATFTTLMNWAAGKTLLYEGEEWGQKDREFSKIIDCPRDFPELNFSIVISQTGVAEKSFPKEQIRRNGWRIEDPDEVAGDWRNYRHFISRSAGEFSIAKETYVKGRTGWFSCRSACYLAAGRPVVTQDTAWSKYYPTGLGLFGFSTPGEAREALRAVAADPGKHQKAARSIALDCFDSGKVLTSMLDFVT